MALNDVEYDPVPEKLIPASTLSHYYGDRVRQLFVVGGLLMLVAIPFFNSYLPVPALLSLVAILAIAIVAGLTNPRQRWVMALDVTVSLVALVAFEYHAINTYGEVPLVLTGMDQLLAIVFFFALYLSTKTLRGALVSDRSIRKYKREKQQEVSRHHLP